jgi:hypothetical protein
MTRQYLGKGSVFAAVAALFSASGGGCPPSTPMPTAPSLSGLWTGAISGDVMQMSTASAVPPNPNPTTFTAATRLLSTQQLVFNDGGIPSALPLPVSAFSPSLSPKAVTAFNVGETQTITNTTTSSDPAGAANTESENHSETITLLVTESALSADHFRVVYATTDTQTNTLTTLEPGFTCNAATITSTGTLTIEATAVTDGLLTFSVEFNNSGNSSDTEGASPCPPAAPTTTTENATPVGKLEGILGRD